MYGTLANLKLRCRVSGAGDDVLLTGLLVSASSMVDQIAGRVWVVGPATRRYGRYNALFDPSDGLLLLDSLLDTSQTVTVTNGDGVVVADADRFFMPPSLNGRAWAIGIEAGSGIEWDFGAYADGFITVLGTWIAPELVDEAAYIIAKTLYRQGEEGALTLEEGLASAENLIKRVAGFGLGVL